MEYGSSSKGNAEKMRRRMDSGHWQIQELLECQSGERATRACFPSAASSSDDASRYHGDSQLHRTLEGFPVGG